MALRVYVKIFFRLCGRSFPPRGRGKGHNRNLTRNSVADAKMPSIFPNFSKFFLISQNPRNSEKNPPTIWVGFFRGADFGGEKTSLNSDVNCNSKALARIS